MSSARTLDDRSFSKVFEERIVRGDFNEVPDYYPRYRSRYIALLRLYAKVAGAPPVDFMDIGGGQFATMAKALWDDRVVAADLGATNLDYLHEQGVETVEWNLISDDQPYTNRFDVIMFSEVIEHLPIPGHIVLDKLRRALKPGGLIICSTPNLYRLRNIVFMVMGKRIFTNFDYPTDQGLGHVLEYDQNHLRWQFERAGFEVISLERKHFAHAPNQLSFRILATIGSPLYWIPKFRDQLIVVARAPRAS